jgi:hypothetical protein
MLASSAFEGDSKPAENLGKHLLIFYWHGRLALDDSMLVRFFEVASDEVRSQVLANVGQDLRRGVSLSRTKLPNVSKSYGNGGLRGLV